MQVGDLVKGISDTYCITNTDMTCGVVTDVNGSKIKVRIMQHKNNSHGCFKVESEHFEVIGKIKPFNREELIERLAMGEKEAIFEYDLRGADLSDTNLRGTDLRGANLSDTNLRDTGLGGANLKGANLSDADLRDADLRGTDLRGADLSDADLRGTDLRGANLSNADLRGADLRDTDLRGADLGDANLNGADIRWADLSDADLSNANLRGADLRGADLSDADLVGADLRGAKHSPTTSFYALQCPESGAFIGYKKADRKIVKLLITEDAKRSSATSRKCRCSKAEVISITNIDGTTYSETGVKSDHDSTFVYEVGQTVEVKDYDDNRWNECAAGIHFFITRGEAVQY